MKKIKSYFLVIFFLFNQTFQFQSQTSKTNILSKNDHLKFVQSKDLFGTRGFVENKGQFKDINGQAVLFALEYGSEKIYFTSQGLIYKLAKEFPITEEQLERVERGKKMNLKEPEVHFVYMNWLNANTSINIEKSERQSHYITYGAASLNAYPYKKITYKNVYNNIDIEYVIPEDKNIGIKYNLILHPDAKIEDIQIAYTGAVRKIKSEKNGDILIKTPLEDITEHAPRSFYLDGESLESSFNLNFNKIGFKISTNYNHNKTLVIDPWVTTITTIPANNSAYDVDYDDFGNLYVYGGASSCKIAKFNTAGTLLWTFSGTVGSWTSSGISNFVVMKSTGKCYAGQGFITGGATIIRLNTFGNYDNYTSSQLSSWNEVWDMAYHCSTGNVYGMGGSTASNQSAGILNPTSGNISPIAFFTVGVSTGVGYDVVSHAIDDAGEFFWIYASGFTPNINNNIAHINSAFTSSVWIAPSGFSTFNEYTNKSTYLPATTNSNGFNCLAVNANYLFYYDGYNIAAYNKTTGAMISSTTNIGLTAKRQGGIAVDDCNNLYIGGNGNINCYNFNGSTFAALPNISLGISTIDQFVYDIKLNKLNKILYVSGSGFAGVYSPIHSLSCCTSSLVCAFSPPALTANSTSITCATLGSATLNPIGGPGPYSYTWIPSGQTGSVATGLWPGTHSLVVFDGACNQTYSATTTIYPLIPLTGSVSSAIPCGGINSGTAAITNLAGGSSAQYYLWSNGISSYSNAAALGLTAGNWSVTVTDSLTGCLLNQTFILSPPSSQTLILTQSSTTACVNASVSLLANIYGGTPGYSFTWVGGPNAPIYQASQTQSGTHVYTLNVHDANNCLVTKTISVNYLPAPSLTAISTSICPNKTGTLTVSGANTYMWSNSIANSVLTDNPLSTTVYTVVGTGAICSASTTASIVVLPIPSPTLATNSPICSGQTLQLIASGGNSYLWNGPLNFNSPNQLSTINSAVVANSGIYSATVTGANSCSATISQSVLIYPYPSVSALGSSVCVNQTLTLTGNSTPGNTFFWSGPNSYTSNLQNPSIINPTVSRSGTYFLLVTDLNGCTNSTSAQVTVTALPLPLFSSNNLLCKGDTLKFNASASIGGINYSWIGPNGFSSNIQNPQINAVDLTANGTYSLSVNAGPCVSSISHTVIVYPLPTVSIIGLTQICETKSIVLTANALGNGLTYSWHGPLAFTSSSPNIVRDSSNTGFAGNYFVKVTDNKGCANTDTALIGVLKNPKLIVSNVSVCLYEPAILNVSGASSYYWWGPNFYQFSGQNALINSANNLSKLTYTVIGTAANSCTSIATVDLETRSLPNPSLSILPKPILCLGEDITFTGYGGSTYQWRGPNTFYYEGTSLKITVSTHRAGTYTLTAIDASGCRMSTDTFILVHPLPMGILKGTTMESCVPFCADFDFMATGTHSITSNWLVKNKNHNASTFSDCFDVEGIYPVKGMLYDIVTTCSNTLEYNVIGRPKPIANFSYFPSQPVENVDEVVFTNTSLGDELNKFNWFFVNDKGFSTNSRNTSYLFGTEGEYPVVLLVKNKWDCSDTAIQSIKIEPDFTIYIPDAFTPNEDGLNEVFKPVIRTSKFYHFSVFDRWGALIFETDQPDKGWDGTYNGQPCKSDVYVWTISIASNMGENKNLKGHVTLYR
ncbi:DUF7948 domain-containing protein [Aurantibacillus circumpalustris]|uniref:DUF7948 domain-containing protein n=1 Tax=Aurantibacillus circumpalustris TaxID=3036359 RepID=UPI00295A5C3F|nr:T9SS type B sorting domain-containing protein [Aurantibacillus circumpalustris]